MKYMVTFDWQPDSREKAAGIERFKRDGAQMPKGVKPIGRWTRADLGGGFIILESDDAKALASFAHRWSDLMQLNIAPVLEDAELAAVFAQA